MWAAKRVGRPVKWIPLRSEGIMTDDHGRDQVLEGEMAVDKDGRMLGVRVKAMHNVGAYISGGGAIPLLFSLMLLPGVYDVGAFDAQTSAVFTNTAPTSPYRGAGRPEAIYAIERMIDQVARDLKMDRAELHLHLDERGAGDRIEHRRDPVAIHRQHDLHGERQSKSHASCPTR